MPVIADFLLVALSILAPALGGSTFLWAKALLFLLAGFIIFANPSRHRLPKPLLIIFSILVGMALVSFLPAGLFGDFQWRTDFEKKFETPLPGTLTPQPYVTLEDTLLMIGSLFWASFVITRGVTVRRRTILSVYASGIIALTLVSFALFLRGLPTDFWHPLNGKFGFFPNRNHTANVLALGGIVTLALAYDNLTKNRRIGWLWVVGYLLIAAGLVVNYSRAGVILFFLGSAIWFGWVTWKTKEFKRMAIGGSALLFGLAAFLMFGGRTTERFVGPSNLRGDLRVPLQKDALLLIKDTWWHGVGLGNFEPIFNGYRKYSADFPARAIHPESDWLLAGAELGALAPILVLMGLGYLIWRRWPSPGESSFHLRAAAMVGVIVFAVHGFVDVPGHRFGALWPALFLLSMTEREEEIDTYRPWLGKLYRAGAFLLCILGMAWLMDCYGPKRLPTSAAVYSTKQDIIGAYDGNRHSEVIAASTRGLAIAPLDYYFYYNRGLAEAWILSTPERAIADLSRAYYLERTTPGMPFTEGRIWLNREPQLAVQAWSRALQLVRGDERDSMFHSMLLESSSVPEARKWLRELAIKNMSDFLEYLAGASPQEFKTELAQIRAKDPELKSLTEPQRKRLFEVWRSKGDVDDLADTLNGNASFSSAGWMALAEAKAAKKDYQGAFSLAISNAPKPVLPTTLKPGTNEELLRSVLFEKDFVAGYALYQRYINENKPGEALKTLRSFLDNPACPKYFHYLAAQREAEIPDWERAWKSLFRYLSTAP